MRLMKGESGHSFLSGKLHFPRRSVPQYVETPQWKHLQTFRSISQRSFFILLLFGEKSEHLSIFEKEIGGKECALFRKSASSNFLFFFESPISLAPTWAFFLLSDLLDMQHCMNEIQIDVEMQERAFWKARKMGFWTRGKWGKRVGKRLFDKMGLYLCQKN